MPRETRDGDDRTPETRDGEETSVAETGDANKEPRPNDLPPEEDPGGKS